LRQVKVDLQRQQDENGHLREENNMIQGRCLNLQRDIELSASAMNKLSDDSGSMGTQMGMLKSRVAGLEEELSRVREEKTDQVFEIRKLT
jgi:chromosome segregation ATPase